MKMSALWRLAFVLAAVGFLCATALDGAAQTGPVKVTIETAKNESSEGASLPVDPTVRVRYGVNQTQMPGLGGMKGERLTFSPQGGHDMMAQIDGQIVGMTQGPGKWLSRNVPLGKGPGGRKREGVKSEWALGKVHITQIIEIVPSKSPPKGAEPGAKRHMDVMLVRYIIENKDGQAHSVGVRNTIDIFLIDNDGALFASPQTHKGQIVNGHEFKGDKMPDYIQVLQRPNLQAPGYVTHFTLKVGKLEPPTRFVCTNLGACFNGGWDIPAQPAGDSAVGILFDPKQVAGGGKRDMAFAYGIGIASNPENEGRVTTQLNGSFEVGKQFTITAYVDDPLESQSLALELPPGLERVDGKETQAVPAPSEMNGSLVLWKVRVDKVGQYTIRIRSSNGIIYNTLVKIEPAEKSELVRIEPKQTETQPQVLTPSESQPPKKGKKTIKQAMNEAAVDLALLQKTQKELEARLKEVDAALAKLGANDAKAKPLQQEAAELEKRSRALTDQIDQQRLQLQSLLRQLELEAKRLDELK